MSTPEEIARNIVKTWDEGSPRGGSLIEEDLEFLRKRISSAIHIARAQAVAGDFGGGSGHLVDEYLSLKSYTEALSRTLQTTREKLDIAREALKGLANDLSDDGELLLASDAREALVKIGEE